MKTQQKINEQVRALVDKDGHIVTDRKLVAEQNQRVIVVKTKLSPSYPKGKLPV